MENILHILILIVFFIIGLIAGLVIQKIRMHKKKTVGYLKIITNDEINKPYIFLQLSKNAPTFKNKQYIYLQIKKQTYDDENDKLCDDD